MNNEEKKFELLKPDKFSAKDPNNPQNLDTEKVLEEIRKRRVNDFANKIASANKLKEKK